MLRFASLLPVDIICCFYQTRYHSVSRRSVGSLSLVLSDSSSSSSSSQRRITRSFSPIVFSRGVPLSDATRSTQLCSFTCSCPLCSATRIGALYLSLSLSRFDTVRRDDVERTANDRTESRRARERKVKIARVVAHADTLTNTHSRKKGVVPFKLGGHAKSARNEFPRGSLSLVPALSLFYPALGHRTDHAVVYLPPTAVAVCLKLARGRGRDWSR